MAIFAPGKTIASVYINQTDNMILEDDECFMLNINRSELPSYIVVVSPSSATVHIQDDECKKVVVLDSFMLCLMLVIHGRM